ncbi:nucleophile aminohydrolase [Piptocephalis cylindrospora]|uniref:Proteasome subunit beta n=1 Tax=Piptocephalis cylindrospora TaxID=1907219 RepID=A0A4P9Y4Q3_9FUNG|nr:nucleophile aminohydrolase [Piptocephalis cylindrospora]|eukprot:RKP13927.1 nucleophile aminohydrolase [Piptocephalis cylindrospora]
MADLSSSPFYRQPLVTGTSVLGIKYKDGVMMAADCLASYGSLARFRDVERLFEVTNSTLIGTSGDISDLQYIKRQLERLIIREESNGDGHSLGTPQIYEYLCQVMYGRRSKMNPLWNSHVVGGMDEAGKPFLGFVNLQGTTYQSTTIATGFGAHLAQPILRKAVEGREHLVTEEEARKLLEDCMRVLFYRDARSMNKFQRATITSQGVTITEPYGIETEWAFAEGIRGYGAHQD